MTNNGDKPAIRVKGLRKSFGEQTVLDYIDLELARGETLAVIGRSGIGKSVLLKLIIGLQKPDAGEIQVNDEEITRLDLDALNQVRKTIGFLFQGAALYDALTVEENVSFPLERHVQIDDGERRERAHKLLARVGMDDAVKKMPADISGGMK